MYIILCLTILTAENCYFKHLKFISYDNFSFNQLSHIPFAGVKVEIFNIKTQKLTLRESTKKLIRNLCSGYQYIHRRLARSKLPF